METRQKIKLLLFAMLGSFLMVATSGAEPSTLFAAINEPLPRRSGACRLAIPFL